MKYAPFPRLFRVSLVTFLLLMAAPHVALSAPGDIFYVDAGNSSASDSNDGSESRPWKTIQKAASTLTAGETVLVKAGTYTELYSGYPNTSASGLKPQNSGTADAPIIFKAYPGHHVVIDQQQQGAGFYILKRNHLVIDGFEIKNARSGGVYTADSAEAIVVKNNHIHHIDGSSGGNVGGIKFDGCGYCTADSNRIHNIYVGGTAYNQNVAGLHSFDMHHTTISNNEFSDVYRGVYHKRSSGQKGVTIHNNTFRNIYDSGVIYSVAGGSNPGHKDQEVYENIFDNVPTGVKSTVWETSTVNDGLLIHNNIFNTKTAISLAGHRGVEIWDNIFLGNEQQIVTTYHSGGWDNHIDYSDHNLYDSSLSNILERYGNEQSYGSLETWQDAADTSWVSGNPGANSLVGSSGCVDPSASDYQLLDISIAKGAGRYGDDIGAYPNGAGSIRPQPPTNVIAQ
ncbi:right-handed parallel beta-helix repeat-containing protein [Thiohalomonas denitrificans]|uniref:right-handed parallel beta-helix repeat-containing protein n=1 Tax=Thiohalomonas denitrificans TaxID=415747 RepID=UPI0026E9CC16|nr:right-handed parallel beta-helix repeat-containing protein [Thiohalomonas denitrificans]